jgi:hypothetical protein
LPKHRVILMLWLQVKMKMTCLQSVQVQASIIYILSAVVHHYLRLGKKLVSNGLALDNCNTNSCSISWGSGSSNILSSGSIPDCKWWEDEGTGIIAHTLSNDTETQRSSSTTWEWKGTTVTGHAREVDRMTSHSSETLV